MKIWLVLVTILLTATTTFGAGSSDILGSWKTEGDDSLLEFFKCGEKICGKIVWLKHPNYTDIKDGPVGKIIVDRKNPNPGLRTRPILGLQIMKGLTAKGNNRWGNGSCYDPDTGSFYVFFNLSEASNTIYFYPREKPDKLVTCHAVIS